MCVNVSAMCVTLYTRTYVLCVSHPGIAIVPSEKKLASLRAVMFLSLSLSLFYLRVIIVKNYTCCTLEGI